MVKIKSAQDDTAGLDLDYSLQYSVPTTVLLYRLPDCLHDEPRYGLQPVQQSSVCVSSCAVLI